MKKIIIILLVIVLSNSFYSCLRAQKLSEPEKNFEHLWKEFDRRYATFGVKQINWDAIYEVYRPKVTPKTSDDELFNIMSEMLGHLNDNHVSLGKENPTRYYSSGFLYRNFIKGGRDTFRALMSQRPVPDKYFEKKITNLHGNIFGYAWLPENIGYFHFRGFRNIAKSTEAIDDIINQFKDARAIIVDVRRNGGGDDRVGKLIADRFADNKRLYMTTEVRNGSDHNDFDPKKYWYAEPAGPLQFTKSVVLLTDRTSISAAENFALAMRILPNVTLVGDFTSGCFADMAGDRLPNGWTFSVAYNLFLDCNGFCWEGIGVPPDIMQTVNLDITNNETDKVLELAISLIKTGKLNIE